MSHAWENHSSCTLISMLDVHPPHEPVHGWRDFFVHIATIVVGLLIAVGIEQIVERIHSYYELRETREALEREYDSNRTKLTAVELDWFSALASLQNDLVVLQYLRDHLGTPQTELPGDLRWGLHPFLWDHAIWDAAVAKGVVRLMPIVEANRHSEFYGLMTTMSGQSLLEWDAINDAHRFALMNSDPTRLTPPQLDEVIRLTGVALEKHIQFGLSFGRYAHENPEMPHLITWDKIDEILPNSLREDPLGMAGAHQRSDARIKSALSRFGGATEPRP